MILISGSKSVKFAQKFRIFLKFLTLEGTLASSGFNIKLDDKSTFPRLASGSMKLWPEVVLT